jgi:hypothetical protein
LVIEFFFIAITHLCNSGVHREQEDRTFLNTERNRGHLSPRDRIINLKGPDSPSKPLIKTLINDITKLKNDTYLSNCLDYLNQNFNKTLDDLVELEDNKKLACNTRLNAMNTTTEVSHNNNNNNNNNHNQVRINSLLNTNKPVTKIIGRNDNKNFNGSETQVKSSCANMFSNNKGALVEKQRNQVDEKRVKPSRSGPNAISKAYSNGGEDNDAALKSSNLSDQIKVSILGGGKKLGACANSYLTNQQQIESQQQQKSTKSKFESRDTSCVSNSNEGNNRNANITTRMNSTPTKCAYNTSNTSSSISSSCSSNQSLLEHHANDPVDLSYLNNYAKQYVEHIGSGNSQQQRALKDLEREGEEKEEEEVAVTTAGEKESKQQFLTSTASSGAYYNKNDDENKADEYNYYINSETTTTTRNTTTATVARNKTDFPANIQVLDSTWNSGFDDGGKPLSDSLTGNYNTPLTSSNSTTTIKADYTNTESYNNNNSSGKNNGADCVIKQQLELLESVQESEAENRMDEGEENRRPLPRSVSIISDLIESENSESKGKLLFCWLMLWLGMLTLSL